MMNLTTNTDAPTTIRALFQQWRAKKRREDTATSTDDAAFRALFDTVDGLERADFTLKPETPADVAALAIMSFEDDYLDKGERPRLSADAERFLSIADNLLAISG